MKLLSWIGSTAILIVLAGCSSGSNEAASYDSPDPSTKSASADEGYKLASKQESKPAEKVDTAGAVRHRNVIRNATMKVRVPNVEESERRVTQMLNGWGGYVENSASTNLASETPSLEMTLRVPVTRFDDALKIFGDLGTVAEKSITGEDVTARVVDLDARLATMKATEDSVRQLLESAHGLDEITSLREKLGDMRADIESVMAQRKALGELASLSTIKLSLEQRSTMATAKGDPAWAQEAWASSSNGVMGILRGAGSLGIMTMVYVPVWGPLAFLAWFVAKHRRRSTSKLGSPNPSAPFQF